MAKEDLDTLEMTGVVVAAKGNGIFFVKPDDAPETIKCTLSGKIQKHNIKITEGSEVKIKVSVYDLTKGRITYRIKWNIW